MADYHEAATVALHYWVESMFDLIDSDAIVYVQVYMHSIVQTEANNNMNDWRDCYASSLVAGQ